MNDELTPLLSRIADALDRGHVQTVKDLRVEIGDADLRLCAESTGDLSVEEAALAGKADLFEEITGLKVSLRRCMTRISTTPKTSSTES